MLCEYCPKFTGKVCPQTNSRFLANFSSVDGSKLESAVSPYTGSNLEPSAGIDGIPSKVVPVDCGKISPDRIHPRVGNPRWEFVQRADLRDETREFILAGQSVERAEEWDVSVKQPNIS